MSSVHGNGKGIPPVVYVTPKDALVIANGAKRTIFLPAIEKLERMDRKIAKATGGSRIAGPHFERQITKHLMGGNVDLAWGGQLRFCVGFGLTVNGEPVYGKYDATHPVAPHVLTNFAGFWGDEGEESPEEGAGRELCEELIVADGNGVRPLSVDGISFPERAQEYAARKGTPFCSRPVNVTLTTGPMHYQVHFGDEVYTALVGLGEPQSSVIDLIFTGDIQGNFNLYDGEKIPGGKWRDEPIIRDPKQYRMNTRARLFTEAHQAGLTKL